MEALRKGNMATITEKLERLKKLERERIQIKRAFSWMLLDIKHRADETKPDDYSPELNHSISVGEKLEEV